MMSHLDPAKSNNQANAPCMRSKRHPPRDVRGLLFVLVLVLVVVFMFVLVSVFKSCIVISAEWDCLPDRRLFPLTRASLHMLN